MIENPDKNSKHFKSPLIFQKQEKMFKWYTVHLIYKNSQIHNTKTIFLVQKNHLNVQMLRFTYRNWLSWDIGGFENIHFLCIFLKFQVRNTPISWFREIGFKIPLFLWNLDCTRRALPEYKYIHIAGIKTNHWDT